MGTVIRFTPSELFKRICETHDLQVPQAVWAETGVRKRIQSLMEIIQNLPDAAFARIDCVLRDLFDISCKHGRNIIREALELQKGSEVCRTVPDDYSDYAFAAWVYLDHPDVFALASKLFSYETATWWRKRDHVPIPHGLEMTNASERLATAISGVLQEAQGRGRRCVVECTRAGHTDYFAAYPEDHAVNITTISDEQQLVSQRLRPTFTVVFALRRDTGSLELSASLSKKIKIRLEQAFAKSVLGTDLPDELRPKAFNLSRFKETDFRLVTEPDDGLTVAVSSLRIMTTKHNRELECKCSTETDSMRALIEECLDPDGVHLPDCAILGATLVFEFAKQANRDKKKVSVKLSADSWTAPNLADEWKEYIDKYFLRWKIHESSTTVPIPHAA